MRDLIGLRARLLLQPGLSECEEVGPHLLNKGNILVLWIGVVDITTASCRWRR